MTREQSARSGGDSVYSSLGSGTSSTYRHNRRLKKMYDKECCFPQVPWLCWSVLLLFFFGVPFRGGLYSPLWTTFSQCRFLRRRLDWLWDRKLIPLSLFLFSPFCLFLLHQTSFINDGSVSNGLVPVLLSLSLSLSPSSSLNLFLLSVGFPSPFLSLNQPCVGSIHVLFTKQSSCSHS